MRPLRLPRLPRLPRLARLPRLVPVLVAALLVLGAHGAGAAVSGPVGDPSGEAAQSRDGVWPLSPRPQVVRGFVPPASLFGPGHRGVDLLGHPGQAVHASLGGTVTFAGTLAGRGVVVVDHGGVRTTYEPVTTSVASGDTVGRGGVIGTLQRAHSHCFPGACLHWGLYRGGGRAKSYLDPLVLVGAGPIRLLPLSTAT